MAWSRRGGCCYSTPAKAELYLKVSPTPSALTDASLRTLSGRFDDASLATASDHASTRRRCSQATWRTRSRRAPRRGGRRARRGGVRVRRFGGGVVIVWRAAAAQLDREQRHAARRRLTRLARAGALRRCGSRARARANASLPGSESGSSAWRDGHGSILMSDLEIQQKIVQTKLST
ncbi:hypothetical protein EJB05_53064, partial [Eragrostis curvula]